jgi:hypothetical protein
VNYIDQIAAAIGNRCDMRWPDESERALLRLYAVLCLVKGERTCARDVHDAWSAWMSAQNGKHEYLVPFEELDPDIQALDDKYCAAIRKVAETLK